MNDEEQTLISNIHNLEEEQRRLQAHDRPGDKAWAKHFAPLKKRVDTQLARARKMLAKLQSKSGRDERPRVPDKSGVRRATNKRRAGRAAKILIHYAAGRRRRGDLLQVHQEDLVDLLTDLRHLAERDPEFDFDSADATAQNHFDQELAEETRESSPTHPVAKHENKRHIVKSSRPYSII